MGNRQERQDDEPARNGEELTSHEKESQKSEVCGGPSGRPQPFNILLRICSGLDLPLPQRRLVLRFRLGHAQIDLHRPLFRTNPSRSSHRSYHRALSPGLHEQKVR